MKKGEKVEFDPTKHCGAKTRSGGVCLHPLGMGTDHLGSGRCRKHSGNAKGATTPEGKEKRRQAPLEKINQPRTNGARKLKVDLFGERLVGKTKVTYEQVRGADVYDLVSQMASAFYACILDNYTSAQNGTRQAWFLNDRKVLEMAKVLCDDGEIDEEYLIKLRLKLMGYDDKSWGTLVSQATALIERAERLTQMDSQMSLMKNFLVQIIALQEEKSSLIASNIMRQLVVDAGFPLEEHDKILANARANSAMRSVDTEFTDVD